MVMMLSHCHSPSMILTFLDDLVATARGGPPLKRPHPLLMDRCLVGDRVGRVQLSLALEFMQDVADRRVHYRVARCRVEEDGDCAADQGPECVRE